MSDRIMLKPYNLKNLDDFVKVSGKKLDIYFDFELTDFTARVYTDKSNKSHVFYSNYRGRTLTDDDRAKLRDYSGDLNEMVKLCKRNYMGDILDGGDTFTTVCDVVLIPEVKGLSFISYGYKIGRACAEKWFNNHDDSPIDYILVESAESISGETLQRVAKRYAFMDIKISSNLGYMLYNRQIAVKDKDGKVKRPAEDNVRRYGVGPGVSDLASLMRNFTDFIPIGFKWATYTPLCYVKDDFKEYLSNNTVFGMDWIEVPNKNMDGNSLPSGYRPEDSLTFYTTKRCIHRVLRTKLDGYNFRFFNEIIYGLFLDGLGFIDPKYIAIKANDTKSYILPIEYEALDDDSKTAYNVVSSDASRNVKVRQAVSAKLTGLYWNTMSADEDVVGRDMANRLATVTRDSIKYNVAESREFSNELFDYIS